MLKIAELGLNKEDYMRMLDIKSCVLLGTPISREDRQWVLDTAARVKKPLSAKVIAQAQKEGYNTTGVLVEGVQP